MTALLLACATPKPVKPSVVLSIAQIDRGVQIPLPSSILFATGKAEINTELAAPYLDRVAELLKTKTDKKVAIEGHTDNAGTLAGNQKLSEDRAMAIANEMRKRGLPEARIQIAGLAFHRPLVDNGNEEGRKLNRRTELIVLDEKVETFTKGEAAGAFEDAFAKIKQMVDAGIIKPAAAAK